MAWTKEPFGTALNGAMTERYILTNKNGVSASFTNLGGTWLTMIVPDQDSRMEDVLMGYGTAEDQQKGPGHMGEIIGRNANRIGDACFTLNGITYALTINHANKNNIHSGPDFFRDRIWDTEITEQEDETTIHFSLFSPDGDQGYPGNASITVSYTLTSDNSVRLDFSMDTDEDTICNLTNHAYFNLGGHNCGRILDHKVWMDADFFTKADETSTPTGELVPVKGTPMDFNTAKTIGQDIDQDYEPLTAAGGYDHNWVLNHPEGVLSLCAKVSDEQSGRMMEVYTDLPGIQFYTSNIINTTLGKDGTAYLPRSGYCFETQYFPNAINIPSFPSPVLKAGETFHSTTIYKFTLI